MIALAAIGAGEAASDAIDQRVLVHLELDDMVQAAATRFQNLVERFGLGRSARIAVEDDAGLGRELVERIADDPGDDLVGDELSRLHHRLGLEPDRRARLDRRAQHVAGRQLLHAAFVDQTLGLGALARARRAQKNDIHG